MHEKRKAFRELCNSLKLKATAEPNFAPDAITVNDLVVTYYHKKGHTELHTFRDWLKKGYCVNKGEKALILWAKPIIRKDKKQADKKEPTEEDGEEFFPICFVFSNKQVSELKKRQ